VKTGKRIQEMGAADKFWETEYLTLDLGGGIMTETGQIKAVNKFKYLGFLRH
jgi:hypothetical protein